MVGGIRNLIGNAGVIHFDVVLIGFLEDIYAIPLLYKYEKWIYWDCALCF